MYTIAIPSPSIEEYDVLAQLAQIRCGDNVIGVYWRNSHRQVLFETPGNVWYIQPGGATIRESIGALTGNTVEHIRDIMYIYDTCTMSFDVGDNIGDASWGHVADEGYVIQFSI